MMKFFVYELKKNVWTLVVLTALDFIRGGAVREQRDLEIPQRADFR